MKNLAVLCPSQTDATSFYRGIGPLAELRRERSDLSLAFINDVNWATLKLCDAVFLQRPFTQAHLQIAELAKRNRLPLWVDYDDDLFAVPEWNPCAATYRKPEVQKAIATIAAMADVVSVSTPALAERLGPLNRNIRVVPNAVDERLVGPRPQEPRKQEHGRLVMWRGSRTHRADLNVAAEACIQLCKAHPEVTWFFLGDAPWFADYMPHEKIICSEPVDPIEYWELLARTRPDVFIVPLQDCPFNRAKSNIAWLEATWAGAATLAPDFPEWQRPGVFHFSGSDGFLSGLRSLLEAPRSMLERMCSDSWYHIEQNLTLSTANKARHSILEGLGL